MTAGAIDAYRPNMCPVVLGAGRPLFADHVPRGALTLEGVGTFDLGALSLRDLARR